jgi:hypothetical protein
LSSRAARAAALGLFGTTLGARSRHAALSGALCDRHRTGRAGDRHVAACSGSSFPRPPTRLVDEDPSSTRSIATDGSDQCAGAVRFTRLLREDCFGGFTASGFIVCARALRYRYTTHTCPACLEPMSNRGCSLRRTKTTSMKRARNSRGVRRCTNSACVIVSLRFLFSSLSAAILLSFTRTQSVDRRAFSSSSSSSSSPFQLVVTSCMSLFAAIAVVDQW